MVFIKAFTGGVLTTNYELPTTNYLQDMPFK